MLSLYSLSLIIIFVIINVNAMNTYFESDNRYSECRNSELIKTIEECNCAAKKLKLLKQLNKKAAIEVDKPKSNWPGCYITNDGLYFNSDVDNRHCYGDSGRYRRKCLCISSGGNPWTSGDGHSCENEFTIRKVETCDTCIHATNAGCDLCVSSSTECEMASNELGGVGRVTVTKYAPKGCRYFLSYFPSLLCQKTVYIIYKFFSNASFTIIK